MRRISELLEWRIAGVVPVGIGVVGFVSVRTPMPFVPPRLSVENDHQMIPVNQAEDSLDLCCVCFGMVCQSALGILYLG